MTKTFVLVGIALLAVTACERPADTRSDVSPDSSVAESSPEAPAMEDDTSEAGDPAPVAPARATDPEVATRVAVRLSEYRIGPSPDTVPAGLVRIDFDNQGERPHTIDMRGNTGMHWRTVPIRPGTSVSLTMSVPAGRYTITSVEPAYVERGMRGVLVVR